MKAARKQTSIEHEVESAYRRKAELLASDLSVRRYGDEEPTRDHFDIYMHREDCGGGFVAYRRTMDSHRHYTTLYGKHSPEGLWSYDAPAGTKEIFE